jgi:hypothetical protein
MKKKPSIRKIITRLKKIKNKGEKESKTFSCNFIPNPLMIINQKKDIISNC